MKTAKSASTWGEPEETPGPLPEILPPPPPPLPSLTPPHGQAGGGQEVPASQLPPGTEATEAGHKKQKEKEGGPLKKPLRGQGLTKAAT